MKRGKSQGIEGDIDSELKIVREQVWREKGGKK